MHDSACLPTKLVEMELAFRGYHQKAHSNLDELRSKLKFALLEAIGDETGARKSFTEAVRQVYSEGDPLKKRTAASILLRSLEVAEVVPTEAHRQTVSLFGNAFAEATKELGIDPNAQTFQQWESWTAASQRLFASLSDIQGFRGDLRAALQQRQIIIKTFAQKQSRPYSGAYPWDTYTGLLREVFEQVEELVNASDQQASSFLDSTRVAIERLQNVCNANPCFASDFLTPFCHQLSEALTSYYSARREGMGATIRCQLPDNSTLGKAYPLFDPERDITISLPFVNEGPATAFGVRATLSSPQEDVVIDQDVSLGSVPPGPFSISVMVLRERPINTLSINVELSWSCAASEDRLTRSTSIRVESQREDIAWADLETSEPYSTGVAEGDQFVGRREKVLSIAARFLRDRMLSTYITGQKRIGKTSLAFAVRDHIQDRDKENRFRFIELEWGSFAGSDPQETVKSLGEQIGYALSGELKDKPTISRDSFSGTLSPLIDLSKRLQKERPELRFIIILDEFDEIHPEMYRHGRLAEALFSNLRTLSSQRNIALMLIGGEKMPFVMSAQGDQLNQFVREDVTYFSRAEEWEDLKQLISLPVRGLMNIREPAISEIVTKTSGHPYYIKLLCAQIFRDAVRLRDADITVSEVEASASKLVATLDVNAFAHYWRDGIASGKDQEEPIALGRCRLLVGFGKVCRTTRQATQEAISSQALSAGLPKHEVQPLLNDFRRRGILKEASSTYACTVPIFEAWLREIGVNRIIVDTLGDEIAAKLITAEERAYVTASEVVELADRWPTYRGQKISVDHIRKWIEQTASREEQRYLFTILQNLHFVSEAQVREKLRIASRMISDQLPQFVRNSKSARRGDILVTYVDGAAKSGAYYASKLAEENYISSKAVLALSEFSKQATAYESDTGKSVNAIIVVDDIIGTGNSMADNLSKFIEQNHEYLAERSALVGAVALFSTKAGEAKVRKALGAFSDIRCDLRVCETIDDRLFAFPEASDSIGFWADRETMDRAKALCLDLGARIYKNNPLGFGAKGLLLVFPTTTPNNSLPILHSRSKSKPTWEPLFERPTN